MPANATASPPEALAELVAALKRAWRRGEPPDAAGRPVVLKLSPDPSGEARTLGPLHHPHVVGVHWARRARDLYAICMPFVGAATLQDAVAAFDASAGGPRSARALLDVAGPAD